MKVRENVYNSIHSTVFALAQLADVHVNQHPECKWVLEHLIGEMYAWDYSGIVEKGWIKIDKDKLEQLPALVDEFKNQIGV